MTLAEQADALIADIAEKRPEWLDPETYRAWLDQMAEETMAAQLVPFPRRTPDPSEEWCEAEARAMWGDR